MDVRQITHKYRIHQWKQIIQECRCSGKTVRAWCEEQEVNEKSFYYWQRKLREEAFTELSEPNTDSELVPKSWTRVELESVRSVEASLTIEAGGCKITANGKTDPELLLKVCRVLKSL